MNDSTANPLGWPKWAWRCLMALAFIFAATSLLRIVASLALTAGLVDEDVPTAGARSVFALQGIQGLAFLSIGTLMVARGRNNPAAVMLGLILLAFGAATGSELAWLPPSARQALLYPILSAIAVISYFWPLFSLEISGGASGHRQARIIQGGAASLAIASIATILVVNAVPALGWLNLVCILADQSVGYAIMAANYRRADALTRNRTKVVLLAFLLLLAPVLLGMSVNWLSGNVDQLARSPFQLVTAALTLAGLAVLAYAVLRRTLFNLNFVLNRTLVYGVVSFILLACFGLAEWGVERLHLIPEQWHEGGTVVSAAIALALFLSFHRLRDWVERHVERLLFSSWHRNEAALRRFIEAADHFGNSAALQKAFAKELSRFCGGGEAALFLRGTGGDYPLHAGKLSTARRRYADDDRALALMRAERRPVDIRQAHSDLPGALALPMLDQGTLLGFALLGPKADGTDYRPDEVELLGWAVQQVGFAVQAQHVRQLEGTIADLRAEVAALSKGRRAAVATA